MKRLGVLLMWACIAGVPALTSSMVGAQQTQTECNGHLAVSPPEPPPWPEMVCQDLSCGGSCSLDSMELDTNTTLSWCECDPSGEPTCCHTIQKTIDDQLQEPTRFGTCHSECGGGTCSGDSGTGFTCQ